MSGYIKKYYSITGIYLRIYLAELVAFRPRYIQLNLNKQKQTNISGSEKKLP